MAAKVGMMAKDGMMEKEENGESIVTKLLLLFFLAIARATKPTLPVFLRSCSLGHVLGHSDMYNLDYF